MAYTLYELDEETALDAWMRVLELDGDPIKIFSSDDIIEKAKEKEREYRSAIFSMGLGKHLIRRDGDNRSQSKEILKTEVGRRKSRSKSKKSQKSKSPKLVKRSRSKSVKSKNKKK